MTTKPAVVDVQEARVLRKHGWSYKHIAKVFGCSFTTIKGLLEPEYAEIRKTNIRETRHRKHGLPIKQVISSAGRIPIEEYEARLAEIPSDTRTFSQRAFGDPLPGRSALDRRRAGAS